MKMLLEDENKAQRQVDDFEVIEKSLRDLKSYGPSSFAILTNPDGDFIQVAGGRVTCVLEHRRLSDDHPKRAYLSTKKVPFEGTQTLMFGGGHMQMEPDEILFVDDVVEAFRSFFKSEDFPGSLLWRSMSSRLS